MSPQYARKRPRILVTAGPTREKIDPIRFISNYSTGTFGYEIAKEARRRGFPVTLVSGPTFLNAPRGVKLIRVESASDMRKAVLKEFPRSRIVIMAAAVSDWRPRYQPDRKIKRGAAGRVLKLVQNPDILKELGERKGGRVLAGFALETEGLAKNARRKLRDKNLDIVIANRHRRGAGVFGNSKIDVSIINRSGERLGIHRKTKRELAKIILDKVLSYNILI